MMKQKAMLLAVVVLVLACQAQAGVIRFSAKVVRKAPHVVAKSAKVVGKAVWRVVW